MPEDERGDLYRLADFATKVWNRNVYQTNRIKPWEGSFIGAMNTMTPWKNFKRPDIFPKPNPSWVFDKLGGSTVWDHHWMPSQWNVGSWPSRALDFTPMSWFGYDASITEIISGGSMPEFGSASFGYRGIAVGAGTIIGLGLTGGNPLGAYVGGRFGAYLYDDPNWNFDNVGEYRSLTDFIMGREFKDSGLRKGYNRGKEILFGKKTKQLSTEEKRRIDVEAGYVDDPNQGNWEHTYYEGGEMHGRELYEKPEDW